MVTLQLGCLAWKPPRSPNTIAFAFVFVCRYPSDDINKFLWMVRIGGGEFPEIKERDYIGDGSYRVDNKVTKVWRPVPAASARADPK